MVTRAAEYTKRFQAKRRLLRLCLACGQPVEDGQRLCGACGLAESARSRGKRLRYRALAQQGGTCTKCRRPKMDAGLLCEWHYFQNRAKLARGSTSLARAIRDKLMAQQSRCYYTGTPLVLGVNDSLDHILSVSKHPDLRADIDNVVWCTREVNTMKNGMDREEFLAMCRLLSTRWPA